MALNSQPNPDFIVKERQEIIQVLAAHAKTSKTKPYLESPSVADKILLHRLGLFLTRLDDEVQMTPDFKQKTKIDAGMNAICNEQFGFPVQYVEKAKALLEKWEGQNWGAPVVIRNEEAAESDSDAKVSGVRAGRKRKRTRSSNGDPNYLQLPRPDHYIWGLEGIMHGICYARSINGRRSPQLDPRYKTEQRAANVPGHNGLTVGAWFPLQIVALFKGAHGHAQAGIYGSEHTGAFSVIVSGTYDTLDKDYGDSLYYSGSGSHSNTDPKQPAEASAGTLALHTSLQTEQPVRVLRSFKAKSKWRPMAGLRYDGLYKVVAVNHAFNDNGGMFEQFKLERFEDQEAIDKSRPTPREQRLCERVNDAFPRVTS